MIKWFDAAFLSPASNYGLLAQWVERYIRIVEATGPTPVQSTVQMISEEREMSMLGESPFFYGKIRQTDIVVDEITSWVAWQVFAAQRLNLSQLLDKHAISC